MAKNALHHWLNWVGAPGDWEGEERELRGRCVGVARGDFPWEPPFQVPYCLQNGLWAWRGVTGEDGEGGEEGGRFNERTCKAPASY